MQPCQNNVAQMQQRGNTQIQTAGSGKRAGINGTSSFPKSNDVVMFAEIAPDLSW